jgi:hypothetical protein
MKWLKKLFGPMPMSEVLDMEYNAACINHLDALKRLEEAKAIEKMYRLRIIRILKSVEGRIQ